MLTSRIATVLAEVYRDNGVPLTETAQLLLLARANSTSSRVRLGTIPCCFYCAEVCERYRSYLHASDDFLDTLGVPLQSVVGTEAPGAQRGLSGGGASGVGVEPVQWRVMLLFRSFIDVSANAIALDGRTYCLSYTLGSRVSSVAFTPVQESSPSVLGIKHCRLHYVFGENTSLSAEILECCLLVGSQGAGSVCANGSQRSGSVFMCSAGTHALLPMSLSPCTMGSSRCRLRGCVGLGSPMDRRRSTSPHLCIRVVLGTYLS